MPIDQDEQFKKFIIKTLAGGIIYDAAKHTFHITQRPLHQYRSIIDEQGSQWHISAPMIDHIVKQAADAMRGAQQPARLTQPYVDTRLLRPGEILCIEGQGSLGSSSMELMCLGGGAVPRFYVLDSSATALHPADVVEPSANVKWAPGHCVRLKVYRCGQRYPDACREFLIEKCTQIVKLQPTVIHEVIDSSDTYTYIENAMRSSGGGGGALSFGANPMSLLLHDYSTLLTAYADFDGNGKGGYALNADIELPPHALRSQLMDCGEQNAVKTVRVKTKTRGQVAIDAATGMPGVFEKAKVRVMEASVFKNSDSNISQDATDEPNAVGNIMVEDMMRLVENVQRIVKPDNEEEIADHIDSLRMQFRHCGVSILALLRLLNYFLAIPPTPEDSVTGFVDKGHVVLDEGSLEKQLIELRNENQKLCAQISNAEEEARRWHSQAMVAWVIVGIVVVACIAILLLK